MQIFNHFFKKKHQIKCSNSRQYYSNSPSYQCQSESIEKKWAIQIKHIPCRYKEAQLAPDIIYSDNKHAPSLPSAVPRASVSGTVMSPSMTATNIICSHQPSRHNGRIDGGKRQWGQDSILQERAVVAFRSDGGGKGRVTSKWA